MSSVRQILLNEAFMKKVIVSGIVGNALEWYDFAIYAHFSAIISRMFFPSTDPYVAAMATWGVFAAGFLMRPVGAIVFGMIGDRFGRRTALAISILTMAIPTACIGILPSYNEIGVWAPIALTVIRLLQGLSLGGEFSGSISFVVEHAPDNQRGFAGSTTMFSMCVGILFGSAIASLLYWVYTAEVVEQWAWRLPFLLGLVIGLVGLYIRSHLDESPKYLAAKEEGSLSKTPTREVVFSYTRQLVTGMILYLTVTVPFYTFVFFIKEYLYKYQGLPYDTATNISTISIIIMTALLPLAGSISDKFGRRPVLLFASMGFVICSYPVFMLFSMGNQFAMIGAIIFGMLVGLYMGPIPAVLVELFPTKVRYTGVALSYNLSASLFGGTAPMVFTYLIKATGYNEIVALYVMLFAAISSITILHMEDRKAAQLG